MAGPEMPPNAVAPIPSEAVQDMHPGGVEGRADRGPERGGISARKLRANRANARASTGPRTAAGKTSAAGNARRHGLSLPVLADPSRAAEVEALAQELAREGASPELQELAARIAEAQIELVRVRRARHDLLSRALADPDYESPAAAAMNHAWIARQPRSARTTLVPPESSRVPFARPHGSEKLATILVDFAARLAAMDRYERRALVAAQIRNPCPRCGARRRRLALGARSRAVSSAINWKL